MTEFFNWLLGLFKQFRIFVVVLPWEVVIRCRMGKHVKSWGPGWHFRIPFVDTLQVVNTRLRVRISPNQTLTTKDGQPLSVAFTCWEQVADHDRDTERPQADPFSWEAIGRGDVPRTEQVTLPDTGERGKVGR